MSGLGCERAERRRQFPFEGGEKEIGVDRFFESKLDDALSLNSHLVSLFLSPSLSLSLFLSHSLNFPQNRTYGSPAPSSKIAAFDLVSEFT